jgi:hypothetical protein
MSDISPIELKRGKSVNVALAFAPSDAKPVANGAASAGADTVTIDALDKFMPAGTTVLFSSGATIILSQDALVGTTTLTSNGDAANDLSGNIADDETAVVPSKNFFTSNKQFTARLVLRRKIGNSFNGPEVDVLTTTTSGSEAQSSHGRIRFPNIGSTSSLPNIVLYWSGAESTALPNEDVTVFGDLQITDTAVASTEAIHSIRLRFDIKAEII